MGVDASSDADVGVAQQFPGGAHMSASSKCTRRGARRQDGDLGHLIRRHPRVHPRERLDESEREFRKMVIVAIDQAKRKKQE